MPPAGRPLRAPLSNPERAAALPSSRARRLEIRYRLAWDGRLVSAVLAVFLRVVYGWYRRQANKQGHAEGRCGSVTFVQRFGSAQCATHISMC